MKLHNDIRYFLEWKRFPFIVLLLGTIVYWIVFSSTYASYMGIDMKVAGAIGRTLGTITLAAAIVIVLWTVKIIKVESMKERVTFLAVWFGIMALDIFSTIY